MNSDSLRWLPVCVWEFRRISLLAVAMPVVAVMSGCGSDGEQPAQSKDLRVLVGVTANHGLDPESRITVEAGMAVDHGNVTIHCPADMPACEVVVGANGSVDYDPSGGMPAVMPLSPARMRSRICCGAGSTIRRGRSRPVSGEMGPRPARHWDVGSSARFTSSGLQQAVPATRATITGRNCPASNSSNRAGGLRWHARRGPWS